MTLVNVYTNYSVVPKGTSTPRQPSPCSGTQRTSGSSGKSDLTLQFPVFILDPHFVAKARIGIRRWIFLLECLQDLDKNLRLRGSRLLVVRGNPTTVFPLLFDAWNISHVYFEQDTEPYAISRDASLSKNNKVLWKGIHGHTLYVPKDVIAANKGKAPLTFQGFLKAIESLPALPSPLEAPYQLPPVVLKLGEHHSTKLAWNASKTADPVDDAKRMRCYTALSGPLNNFDVPTLEEMGFAPLDPKESSPHRGGETIALKVLEVYFKDKKKVAKFEKPNTSPAAFDPADTTVLSPHLKFGTLSCRLFYKRIQDIYKEISNHSQPPVSLLGQLYWREFYYTVAFGTPNFDKMIGNPVCLQINWALQNGQEPNSESARFLDAWTNAK